MRPCARSELPVRCGLACFWWPVCASESDERLLVGACRPRCCLPLPPPAGAGCALTAVEARPIAIPAATATIKYDMTRLLACRTSRVDRFCFNTHLITKTE